MQVIKKKKFLFHSFAFAGFFLFILLSKFLFTKEINFVDTSFSFFLQKYMFNHFITFLMKCFTWFCNPICLCFFFFFSFFYFRDQKKSFALCLNLVGIVLLNQMFKFILKRKRPSKEVLLIVSGYSFPSFHAMAALGFYGFFFYLILKDIKSLKKKKILKVCAFFFILLIGLSRIYLGVHYFSDVLAGYCFSYFYLYLFIKGYQNFKVKKNSLKFLYSFKYAIDGIFSSIKSERNMKIHFVILLFVLLFGFLFKIQIWEWIICIFCFALVIGSEIFNTAIETVVDLVTQEKNEKAKLAKDLAAGAVLISAFASACIGLLLFLPKFISLF